MRFITIGVMILVMVISKNAHSASALRIALPTKQIQFDPQKMEDMYSMTVVNQLYARLFKYTPDGQIRPDLVASWTVSKDKKTHTFRLKNMNYSDGSMITALHVENSLKRIFAIQSALASDLAVIKGAKLFSKSKKFTDLGISANDETTLQIQTEKPTSLLIYLLAVPDVGVLKLGKPNQKIEFGIETPFSGPYKLKSLTAEKIELQKWRPSDLDSPNAPQEILFNLYEKIQPDKVALGEITDTSGFMTFDESKNPLDNNGEWRAVPSEAANERFILLNPQKIPAGVRQWMLSKVNSLDFIKLLNDKSIIPAYGFIPNCLPGHLKQPKIRVAPEPILTKTLKVKITYGANLPYAEKFRSYLHEVWKHPKIQFEFDSLPVSKYLEILLKKRATVIIGAKGLDYPEGYSVVTYFRSVLESNFYFVNNKQIDRLIDRASEELDNEQRQSLYEAIQKKVLDEATVIPLAFGSWKKTFWSNRVEEVPPHPIGIHFIPLEMIAMAKP